MTTGETARVKSAGTGPGLRASERAASVLWDGTSALISGGTNEMRFTPPYKQVLRRNNFKARNKIWEDKRKKIQSKEGTKPKTSNDWISGEIKGAADSPGSNQITSFEDTDGGRGAQVLRHTELASWAWGHRTVIPGTREAEAGGAGVPDQDGYSVQG